MAQEHVAEILKQLSAIIADKSSRQELSAVIGLENGIEQLQKGLLDIQSMVDAVEEGQLLVPILDPGLGDRTVGEVLYDIEDLLGGFDTRRGKLQTDAVEELHPFISMGKLQTDATETKKVSGGKYEHTLLDLNLGKSLMNKLNLLRKILAYLPRTSFEQPKRSSFVEVSELHGLDEVKKEIMDVLLSDSSKESSDNIKIISIVGMEGMGKTSLAQCICNEDQVLANFENIIWVSVSDNFDLGKIARAIIQALEGLEHDSFCLLTLVPLQSLLDRIHRKIVKKKSLLVLDGVEIYHDDDWEALKALFQQGMSESRIIVTSRKHSVAVAMESSHVFHLKELSDEMCWMILRQVAFVGLNEGSHENVDDIGRKIAKKCKGLPFAAKVLGVVLQHKTRRKEWLSVLDNNIWKSSATSESIFKPLRLCYYGLPSAIRRCLLYCAIFPKNFEMSKTLLVQHWMAQGYLNSTDDSQMELKGEEYFKCLVAHSFLQDFSKCRVDGMHTCKMHGIVHDFVQSLFRDKLMMEIKSVENWWLGLSSARRLKEVKSARRLEEVKSSELFMSDFSSDRRLKEVQVVETLTPDLYSGSKQEFSSVSIRHLILMIAQGADFPFYIKVAEKLRSLIAVSKGCLITSQALHNLFNQSKHLRLLDLSLTSGWHNCFGPCGQGNILPKFPEEICQLINLRYLNLAGSKEMKILPETLCDLHNLQSLDLTGCSGLTKLPDGMGKLMNLRYLCTWHCSSITFYPKGIGSLTSLRELTNVIVRADCNDAKEFSLGDLEKLNHLCGHLRVKLVGNAIDADEGSRANLWNKKHLNNIKINLDGDTREEVVIKALNPPSGIRIEFICWWF